MDSMLCSFYVSQMVANLCARNQFFPRGTLYAKNIKKFLPKKYWQLGANKDYHVTT